MRLVLKLVYNYVCPSIILVLKLSPGDFKEVEQFKITIKFVRFVIKQRKELRPCK